MIITDPMEIEKRSMEIIESALPSGIPEDNKAVVKRVIHCTADFDYAKHLAFSKDAVKKAIDALSKGCDIVTDTQMALSGINKAAAAKLGCTVHCFMSDPDVAEQAKERGCTRAVVSMEKASVSPPRPLTRTVSRSGRRSPSFFTTDTEAPAMGSSARPVKTRVTRVPLAIGIPSFLPRAYAGKAASMR